MNSPTIWRIDHAVPWAADPLNRRHSYKSRDVDAQIERFGPSHFVWTVTARGRQSHGTGSDIHTTMSDAELAIAQMTGR